MSSSSDQPAVPAPDDDAAPYVATPIGDPAAVLAIAADAARRWQLPDPVVLRAGMNVVLAAGDAVVLRVGRPSAGPSAAVALAAVLLDHGVRVPRPVRDEAIVVPHPSGSAPDVAVLAVERITPSGAPTDWTAVGQMVRRTHELPVSDVPAGYPLPRGTSFPWWDFDALLAEVGPQIDEPARAALAACWDRHRATISASRRDPGVVCHGDVHPGNVVQAADGPVLLDWDLLCREPAGWDHAPLMTWTERWGGEPGIYRAFATGYGADLRGDAFTVAASELRLLAATLMRVRAGAHDPAAAEEAQRRLRWWRGDPDAPVWRAA